MRPRSRCTSFLATLKGLSDQPRPDVPGAAKPLWRETRHAACVAQNRRLGQTLDQTGCSSIALRKRPVHHSSKPIRPTTCCELFNVVRASRRVRVFWTRPGLSRSVANKYAAAASNDLGPKGPPIAEPELAAEPEATGPDGPEDDQPEGVAHDASAGTTERPCFRMEHRSDRSRQGCWTMTNAGITLLPNTPGKTVRCFAWP